MRKSNKKGFTIVELVIVIAVIAILAAVLIPTFSGVVEKANKSKALQEATNMYKEYVADVDYTKDTAYDHVIVKVSDKQFINVIDGKVGDTIYESQDAAVAAISEPCTYIVLSRKTDSNDLDTSTTGEVTAKAS